MIFKRRDRRPMSTQLLRVFYPRKGWRRALEYLGHRVQRLPDTPHRIALGFSCGVFASFTPLFGLHFVVAAAIAWILRVNVVSALIGTIVGNPLTFPLIASISLSLGRRILGFGATGRDFGRIVDAFGQALRGLWQTLLSVFGHGTSQWNTVAVFLRDVVWPYFVGGLLPGLISAIAAYYLIRPLTAAYQSRRRVRVRAGARRRRRALRVSKADDGG